MYEQGEDFDVRFLQHRTIFPRDFLADFGFRTLRVDGRVELMRLELGGICRFRPRASSRSSCGGRARRS